MKKQDRVEFVVRLNLDHPREKDAWEKLQNRGSKTYSEMVVNALCCEEDHVPCPTEQQMIRKVIRETLQEELRRISLPYPVPGEAESHVDADPKFGNNQVAMDFMKSIGM